MTERSCKTCAYHDPAALSIDAAPLQCWSCSGRPSRPAWTPKPEPADENMTATEVARRITGSPPPELHHLAGLWTGACAPGTKADAGKRRYSLLPSGAVEEVVDVLTIGAVKYADDNWKKVPSPRTRYYDAALRHITAWFGGEKQDPETKKHHLAHAITCLMFLMWFDAQDPKAPIGK